MEGRVEAIYSPLIKRVVQMQCWTILGTEPTLFRRRNIIIRNQLHTHKEQKSELLKAM